MLTMLIPIVCFTCGSSLGDLAPIYHYIRRRRMAKRFGELDSLVAPIQAAVDPTLTENMMGDVLEALRITRCCRTRTVTAMIFNDH